MKVIKKSINKDKQNAQKVVDQISGCCRGSM